MTKDLGKHEAKQLGVMRYVCHELVAVYALVCCMIVLVDIYIYVHICLSAGPLWATKLWSLLIPLL